jgi:hypothetical protein
MWELCRMGVIFDRTGSREILFLMREYVFIKWGY